MKKYLLGLFVIPLLFFAPNKVMAATIEISNADLTAAETSGTTPTDKGLTYVSGSTFGAYYFPSGEYSLSENITMDGKIIVVEEDSTVTINFNGKTINSLNPALVSDIPYPVILSDGTLTITGDGKITTSETYYTDIQGNGTTTINNGTFQSVVLNGNSTINGGVFNNEGNGGAVTINGSATINGGTFSANSASSVYFNNRNELYEPLATNTLTITGGTFTSEYDNGIEITGGKTITIKGGTFTGGTSGISFAESEEVKISGGTFVANGSETLAKGGITVYDKTVNISSYLASGFIFNSTLETKTDDYSIYTQKEISVVKEAAEYTILDGANQTYESGTDLVIRADGDINDFTKLLVDNVELSTDYYTTKSGSTIATIKASYLSTLSSGSHTITFVYTNGTVSTTVNIPTSETQTTSAQSTETTESTEATATTTSTVTNPKTSDNILLSTMTLVLSTIGLTIRFTLKNKLFN